MSNRLSPFEVTIASTAAAIIGLSATVALAELAVGDYAGLSESEITDSLEQQGYEVRQIEHEDGLLEAYVLLDGTRYEIFVDPDNGDVVEIEND